MSGMEERWAAGVLRGRLLGAGVLVVLVALAALVRACSSTPPCVKTVGCRFDDRSTMHVCTCRAGEECAR